MATDIKTNVMRVLEQKKIPYQAHEYPHGKDAIDGVTVEEIGYLYAVTWKGNENENVQKLLDWVLSPEGQYIIEQTGYTPINPSK